MLSDMHAGSTPTGRVLIADDDPDFRRILVRRAIRMGLEVSEVKDGHEAIKALSQESFDALVIDLYMPESNGIEVIQEARKIDPDVQSIILTGSASVESAIQALRAGVYDYLTKPLESISDFELSLTRALQHRYLINENRRLFAEVQRLAVTDSLTGLYNRHKLRDSLAVEVERASRYNRPLSIIMIDLDGLKNVNDTFGHPAGDKALKLVSGSIRKSTRKVDLPTRFGGDEFVILLPEADIQEGERVAERICSEIERIDFQGDMLSVSVGIAQWSPEEHERPDDLLHAVDEAMYEAKRAGGGMTYLLTSSVESHKDRS